MDGWRVGWGDSTFLVWACKTAVNNRKCVSTYEKAYNIVGCGYNFVLLKFI